MLPINFTNVYYGNSYSSFNLDPKLVKLNTPITFTIKVTALGGSIIYQQAEVKVNQNCNMDLIYLNPQLPTLFIN